MGDSYIVWSVCGAPGSATRVCPRYRAGSLEPIPLGEMSPSALMQGWRSLVLRQLDVPSLLTPMGDLTLSEEWMWGKVRGGQGREQQERSEGE